MENRNLMIIIVTAENCGPCKKLRGDGKIIETTDTKNVTIAGGHTWNVDFFKKLLQVRSLNPIYICEIHFLERLGNIDSIESFNEIYLEKDKIMRKTYKSIPNKPEYSITIEENGVQINQTINKDSFFVFLKSKIPDQFLNKYINYFPSWYFADSLLWNNAIKNNSDLYVYVNGFSTIKHENKWIVLFQERKPQEDPILIAKKIINKSVKIDYDFEIKEEPKIISKVVEEVSKTNVKIVPIKKKIR